MQSNQNIRGRNRQIKLWILELSLLHFCPSNLFNQRLSASISILWPHFKSFHSNLWQLGISRSIYMDGVSGNSAALAPIVLYFFHHVKCELKYISTYGSTHNLLITFQTFKWLQLWVHNLRSWPDLYQTFYFQWYRPDRLSILTSAYIC